MKHQEFTPAPKQQALIDAAQSVIARGTTVAELVRESNNLLHAAGLLFMNGEYAHDSAKDLLHIASNNVATVNIILEGRDVDDMFTPLAQ